MGGGRLSAHFGPMFTTAQHTLQRSSTDPLSQSMKARFRQQSYGGTCCKTYVPNMTQTFKRLGPQLEERLRRSFTHGQSSVLGWLHKRLL